MNIPKSHPRYRSLLEREKLVESFHRGVVAEAGLIAQGRGEAFDYLLGERTIPPALKATRAAAIALLEAKRPVISVNGNAAAICPKELVKLAELTGAKLEVNLFYRTAKRERAIARVLSGAGAKSVLGVGKDASARIPELFSERRRVSPGGMMIADAVFVPLEDGDRTEALRKLGKTVIAVDLNPLSRTSRKASITIVDNLARVVPNLIRFSRMKPRAEMKFDNKRNLAETIGYIKKRLARLGRQ